MGGIDGFQRSVLICGVLTLGLWLGAGCGNAEGEGNSPARGGAHSEGGTSAGGAAQGGLPPGAAGAPEGDGGAASGTGGTASGGEPSPNDWAPDFPLGEPGWKQSKKPFCDVNRGRFAAGGIWADARGVFALVADACIPIDGDPPWCDPSSREPTGVSLSLNDGSGWRVLMDVQPGGAFGLEGFEGGPLLLGSIECGAALLDVDSGRLDCRLPAEGDPFYRRSTVAHASLAYVVNQSGLHEYRDGKWSTVADPPAEPINDLWANEDVVYLAGEYQLYSWSRDQSEVLALLDAPAARYTAVFGFASDDVWFGNSMGQLTHYDGLTFSSGPIPDGREYPGITQLWGSAGELFFSAHGAFGRVTAERGLETLLEVENFGFWGTSPEDIFISVRDSSFDDTPCGAAFYLYFDGKEFHRF